MQGTLRLYIKVPLLLLFDNKFLSEFIERTYPRAAYRIAAKMLQICMLNANSIWLSLLSYKKTG